MKRLELKPLYHAQYISRQATRHLVWLCFLGDRYIFRNGADFLLRLHPYRDDTDRCRLLPLRSRMLCDLLSLHAYRFEEHENQGTGGRNRTVEEKPKIGVGLPTTEHSDTKTTWGICLNRPSAIPAVFSYAIVCWHLDQ